MSGEGVEANETMVERIQRKRTSGWRMPEGALYVGRPSRFGNPFTVISRDGVDGVDWWVMTRDGKRWTDAPLSHREATIVAVDLFETHIGAMGNYEYDDEMWDRLRGMDLACWCPLSSVCHADVLLEIANAPSTSCP